MYSLKSVLKKIGGRVRDRWYLRRQLKLKTIYMGSEYGGWKIAAEYLPEDPIVYSFGVGEDASFDIDLIQKYNASVWAFDPTPKSIKWVSKQNLPEAFHFFSFGISDRDETEKFYLPKNEDYVSGSVIKDDRLKNEPIEVEMYRLITIMKLLKHDYIDILKMDIEGSEFKVIPDVLNENIRIGQICIEVHGRFFEDGSEKQKRIIQMLNKCGYYIIYVSETLMELTFIKMSK